MKRDSISYSITLVYTP